MLHAPRLPRARRVLPAAFVLLVCSGPARATTTAAAPVVADSTEAPSWAAQIVAARRLVAEAEAALHPAEAARLATQALRATRALTALPGFDQDPDLRRLALDAQAVYERHHGPVRPDALSVEELGVLRGEALAALGVGHAALIADVAEPMLPSALRVPEHAEALVAQQARLLQRSFRSYRAVQRRGARYFPMIEQALTRRGLPAELKYLPVIESGLNPGAVSSAGAIGLWQLLPSTGAMYGYGEGALYHPARSTQAATRYLADLGELFGGDWHLALAAYNCGPGRVQGLVRRLERRLGRTPTFWDLYPHLPAETRAYVPRFIAVARALEDVA